jgi:hypothetical protein
MGVTASLTGVVVAVALWVRYWSELRTPTHPIGDLASDGLMVELARHFKLDHGHYSQFGFFHPGAAMFYVEAAGETVFHNWFHLFPTAYDATWATVLLVNAVLIALSAFCLGVAFDSTRVILASTAGFLVFAIEPTRTFAQSLNGLLVESWIPVQTLWCVLFLICSLVYLLARRPSAFVLVGIAATWVAQRYVVLVPIAVACLAFGWFVAWRTVERRRRGRYLGWGVASVVVLCLPNLIGIAFGWPWQFVNYWHAVAHPEKSPRTVGQSFALVASFWGLHHAWVFGVLLVVGVGVAVLVYRMRSSAERSGYLAIIAVLYVGTALAVLMTYGVNSDVDQLHAYELSFYLGVVALGYGAVAVAVLRWWIAYAVVPALLVFGDFGAPPAVGYLDMGAAQAAIVRSAAGRSIAYVSANSDNWIWIDGMLLEDVQTGVASCAVRYNAGSAFVYAPQHVCPAGVTGTAARFEVNPGVAVPGGQTIYTSKDLDIVRLPT